MAKGQYEPVKVAKVTMPLPPSETRLIAKELDRCADAARARGEPIMEAKFRDRAAALRRGAREVKGDGRMR